MRDNSSKGRRSAWRKATVLSLAVFLMAIPSALGAGAKSGSDPAGVTEAKAIIAKLSARPTSIGLTAKIKKKIPSGKRIAYIQLNIPSTIELTQFLQSAAKALGWKLETITAGLTPETFKAAYAQAIQKKPDAVFSAGIPVSLIQLELKQLDSMGIPVVFLGNPDPPFPGKGVGIANIYGLKEHVVSGKHDADWVIADSNGTANAVYYVLSTFPVLNAVAQGYQQEQRRLCRQTCKLHVVPVQATDIGQALPGQIVAYLRSHPQTTYVVMSNSDLALGVPGALADAGFSRSKIKVVADNAQGSDLVNISAGNFEAADTTFPKQEAMWRVMDILARHFAGEPIAPSVNAPFPEWILDRGNRAKWPGAPEAQWPIVADYQKQYKQLWGK